MRISDWSSDVCSSDLAALTAEIGRTMARHLAAFGAGDGADALQAAARLIGGARRVYFLGLRSCYAVAFQAAYVYGLFRENGLLLDGPGDTGVDALRHSGKGDRKSTRLNSRH